MPTKLSKKGAKLHRKESHKASNRSGNESDHLDDVKPRKKRRVEPVESESEDSDNDDDSEEVEEEKEDAGDDSDDSDDSNTLFERQPVAIDLDDDEDDNDDDDDDNGFLFSQTKEHKRVDLTAKPAKKVQAEKDSDEPSTRIQAPTDPKTTFNMLGVQPWLVKSLNNMAIRRPTAIQKGCIPAILRGDDCIGGSRTGSGKTVAFAIPILQSLAADPSAIFALVLTATRELALQIYEQFLALGSQQTVKAVLVTGGGDMRAQAIALARCPHIVIATPGRLADHIQTSGEDTIGGLKRVKFVVLDEADRLLDPGAGPGTGTMLPDVETCLDALPPPGQRQTLLFTATVTDEVRALKARPRAPGRSPVFVCEVDTELAAIPATLNQRYLMVQVTHREHNLHVFLTTEHNAALPGIIVFCNRTSTANYLHYLLRLLGHRVTALHAKLPQRERTDNLHRFRANAARILVATDVAARGLDIPEVGLVVNYDVPRDPDDYIHRVGRTARAGRSGEAVTFVGQRDVDLVQAIEERVGRQMVEWQEEGVNLETRLLRGGLKEVNEKKQEALLNIEENRDAKGKRKREKQKFRAT